MKKEFTEIEANWALVVFVILSLLVGLFGSGVVSILLAAVIAYTVAVEPNIEEYKVLVLDWIISIKHKVWK